MSLRRSPAGGEPNNSSNATVHKNISPRQLHITPRSSDGDGVAATTVAQETPYGTLRQLANLPKPTTPLRRASSAGPPSHISTWRTPTVQARTPGAGQRIGGSARRPNVLTPHGRAAIREVEARRAGLTPGKDRRRSGRQRRETPRNDLRLLSRLMATKTDQVVPTPQGPSVAAGKFTSIGIDDLDDGSDLVRPRLSLPLGEEDEDDSLLLPPRSAGLEDDNFTAQSIELPRRAVSEQPPGRLSAGSFGSVRTSDRFGDDFGLGSVFESSFAMGNALNDDYILDVADGVLEDDAGIIQDTEFGRGRISLASGRDSNIRFETLPGDDTENTFVFTVPQRDAPIPQRSGDVIKSYSADDNENSGWEGADRLDTEDTRFINGRDGNADVSILEATFQDLDTSSLVPKASRKKNMRTSKHGIQYPSLPAGVVKKLATQYARTGGSQAKISKDTLGAILQASDWFFEQISDDLSAYSKHAGRKAIDESDAVMLMKRQRQTNATTTPFSLAQRILPRELLQELRMAPFSKVKRRQQLGQVEEA